jgi:hypothetical protein
MNVGAPKKPMVAGFLSAIVPGLGQLYCRAWGKGVAFLLAGLGADSVFGVTTGMFEWLRSRVFPQPVGLFIVGSLLLSGVAIWSILDATRTAKGASR